MELSTEWARHGYTCVWLTTGWGTKNSEKSVGWRARPTNWWSTSPSDDQHDCWSWWALPIRRRARSRWKRRKCRISHTWWAARVGRAPELPCSPTGQRWNLFLLTLIHLLSFSVKGRLAKPGLVSLQARHYRDIHRRLVRRAENVS